MRVAAYDWNDDSFKVNEEEDPDADEVMFFDGTDEEMIEVARFFDMFFEEETICVDGLNARAHIPEDVLDSHEDLEHITMEMVLDGTAFDLL